MEPVVWVILALFVLAVIFASRGKKKSRDKPAPVKSAWWIGPIIDRNYSIGMPERPTALGDPDTWFVDVGPGQELDAVIRRQSLRGKSQIAIRFKVTGDGFRASGNSNPAQVTLMFQRRGDDWSGVGAKNFYRWYSRKRVDLTPGEHELIVLLVRTEFGHVQKQPPSETPYTNAQKDAFFAAALNDTDTISLAFGSAGGASHGVRSDTPSRFTLQSIEIR